MKKITYIVLLLFLVIGVRANDTLLTNSRVIEVNSELVEWDSIMPEWNTSNIDFGNIGVEWEDSSTIDIGMFFELDSVVEVDSMTILREQAQLIVDNMPYAVIHQDSNVLLMMIDKKLGIQRGPQNINGYRVQVYASNIPRESKNEALRLQKEVQPRVDVEVYVISEPPFWKVRLGNFKIRDDANKYKDLINELFPELQGSTYVVPDIVTIVY